MQGARHGRSIEYCFPTSVWAESGSLGLSQPGQARYPRNYYPNIRTIPEYPTKQAHSNRVYPLECAV